MLTNSTCNCAWWI